MAQDYFMKYYKEAYKRELSPMGFKLKGRTFYRVVNSEVIQSLTVQRGRFGYYFVTHIGFFPFCLDINFKDNSTFELEQITKKSPPFWEYDSHNVTSIENVLNNALECVKTTAIPLFEKVNDTFQYLEAKNHYEKIIYGDILKVSGNRMYACLKIGRYDEALKTTYDIEEQNYGAMKANKGLYPDETKYQEYCQWIEDDLKDIKNIRNAIINKDYILLDEIVNANEKIMKAKVQEFLNITIL